MQYGLSTCIRILKGRTDNVVIGRDQVCVLPHTSCLFPPFNVLGDWA